MSDGVVKMYDRQYIKNSLDLSSNSGYVLFPEIRDNGNILKLRNCMVACKMTEEIRDYAESILNAPSPAITYGMFKKFNECGDRLTYENAYFERRKQLFSMVLAFIVYGEDKYISRIQDKLYEWCSIYTWELPAHVAFKESEIESTGYGPDQTVGLFAAETAFFFAEILSLIGDRLDPLITYITKREILRRVIDPYIQNEYWWENDSMNWASVCAGSVGAAALYLIDDTSVLSKILEKVLKTMDVFIKGFDKDGLTVEGLAYWNYGFGFYMYFAELLKERTAGAICLLNDDEKIRRIGELPLYLQFPSGLFVNFSDSGGTKWSGNSGLLARLEKLLGVKGYKYYDDYSIFYDHTYKWAGMARDIFWGLGEYQKEAADIKTGVKYYSESQIIIDRRNIDGVFTAFAAKGGHNDEPHNHNDLGNFILHYCGENILIDIGSPEYVKEYFRNETRYSFLAASSLGHSVPYINGHTQGYGSQYSSIAVKQNNSDSKTGYCLDLKEAYPCPELTVFLRSFIWDYENLELTVNDVFNFSKPHNEIKEIFITGAQPFIREPGKVLIKIGNSNTELSYDKRLYCEIEKCSYKDHSGRDSHIYRVIITIDNLKEKVDFTLKAKIYVKNGNVNF